MAPRGKTIQFNQTKKCRFENTLSLCTITTSICKLSIGIIWYKLLSIGRIPHCVFVKEIYFFFFLLFVFQPSYSFLLICFIHHLSTYVSPQTIFSSMEFFLSPNVFHFHRNHLSFGLLHSFNTFCDSVHLYFHMGQIINSPSCPLPFLLLHLFCPASGLVQMVS